MDRTDEERELSRLARRIADGRLIDWEELEGDATPDQVRHLRLVQDISEGHRKLLLDDLTEDTWGDLEIRRGIASGGFGDVFLAHDPKLRRDVALKLFHDDDDGNGSTDRLFEEARRAASVKHPNVVTVHGVGRHDGRTGVWMEWVDGETLEAAVDERGPFTAEEAARIGIELCGALAAIHDAGLVHRDVKLANVVREKDGRAVLMDFGASTRLGEGGEPVTGTPAYLSPEAFEGRDSGPRTDIYALGVLLYRLTSDDYPVEYGLAAEMQAKHRAGERTSLGDRNPGLPADFVEVVERALASDPDQRYSSAREMEAALRATVQQKASPWLRPPAGFWAALVVLGLLGVAYVATQFGGGLEAYSRFYRLDPHGSKERLVPGMEIRPGQQLFLEFEADRPVWLYVINTDTAGEQNLLFPVSGLELQNPVPAGSYVIPGFIEGTPNYWNVTSATGEDLVLVVASTAPLESIEEEISSWYAVTPGNPMRLRGGAVVSELRGIAQLSPAPASQDQRAPSLTDEIVEGLTIHSGQARGVRIWEMALSNPEGG